MSKCVDCGIKCNGVRCQPCRFLFTRGENNSNYKDGRSLKVPCPGCAKPINSKSKSCRECRTKLRYISSNGYVRLTRMYDHPNSTQRGEVAEHVFKMSEYLGRALLPGETVHHINLNRQDNRLENLQLRIGQHGIGAVYVCGSCGSDKIMPAPIADEGIKR